MRKPPTYTRRNAYTPVSTHRVMFCCFGAFLLVQMGSAEGARTCPQYCTTQAGADDCQTGGNALLLATCVCDWIYRGDSRGCVQDFGGFICDGKKVDGVEYTHPRTPTHTHAHPRTPTHTHAHPRTPTHAPRTHPTHAPHTHTHTPTTVLMRTTTVSTGLCDQWSVCRIPSVHATGDGCPQPPPQQRIFWGEH
jgi:hypothetical protein